MNSTKTLEEMLEEQAALQAAIRAAQAAQRQPAIAEIKALMEKHGITVADLNSRSRTSSRPSGSKVPAKYRNPDNGATWTGRGKPPAWIRGKDRSAFEI
ncbi:H-NS histone family protein (plasmid) [Burkholderia glumae]|uniref:H-NS histone family protein n=1 Tax=Burkholderia glumae TaxID=337 RepID=UPI0021513AF1|nr:H-NS histone family protein [Burkholderia glumae]UVS88311.1 H-NS histone family protein [Burkholderia glumae]